MGLGMPEISEPNKQALLFNYPILEYFKYDHLPPHLQEASKPWCDLAYAAAAAVLESHAEIAAGLRKLLEAKDCFVRSRLPRTTPPPPSLPPTAPRPKAR